MALLRTCDVHDQIEDLGEDNLTTHMLLPSSIIRILHDDYPREFVRRLGAQKAMMRSF